MFPNALVLAFAVASLAIPPLPADAPEAELASPADGVAVCPGEAVLETEITSTDKAVDARNRSPETAAEALPASHEEPRTAIRSGLAECALGDREYIGCCINSSKWRCWNYCCKNNQCGLLCPSVWCEFSCEY